MTELKSELNVSVQIEHDGLNVVERASARHDPFTFYSMVVISYLESAVPNYVENLDVIYQDNPELLEWLHAVWLPEESEHGAITRVYVEETWPEYDWQGGYEKFLQEYGPRCVHEELRPSPGLEALARCVTETQATMSYRCILNYSKDAKLQSLMRRMSSDEVRHYRQFRKVFDLYDETEKNSFLTKAQTVIGRSELVKDEDLLMAFRPINDFWKSAPPVPYWGYDRYMDALGRISVKHMPIEQAQKMLFKPMRTKGRINNFLVNCIAGIVKRQFLAIHA